MVGQSGLKYPNVFVLCTGRCGSVTFAQAASHVTNASVGHETRSHMVGAARMAYPIGHIEVDNRLSWTLGRLDQAFGRDAFYVHLLRNLTRWPLHLPRDMSLAL